MPLRLVNFRLSFSWNTLFWQREKKIVSISYSMSLCVFCFYSFFIFYFVDAIGEKDLTIRMHVCKYGKCVLENRMKCNIPKEEIYECTEIGKQKTYTQHIRNNKLICVWVASNIICNSDCIFSIFFLRFVGIKMAYSRINMKCKIRKKNKFYTGKDVVRIREILYCHTYNISALYSIECVKRVGRHG